MAKAKDSLEQESKTFTPYWMVAGGGAPIYSHSYAGSLYNKNMADNERSAGYNFGVGIQVAYQLSPRWQVRSGVHRINSSHITRSINYAATTDL
jgi:hypothetical protein